MWTPRFDVEAWAREQLGVLNEDGGRGYERGIRIVDCPFCNDTSGKGWVNVVKGTVGCFHPYCEARDGMLLMDAIARLMGYTTKTQAFQYLRYAYPLLELEAPPLPKAPASYQDWCRWPPAEAIPIDPQKADQGVVHREVLAFLRRQWGLAPEDAGRWELCYVTKGRHAWRVLIPIRLRGQVVAFQTRSFRGAEPKYLMSKQGARDDPHAECGRPGDAVLFNLDAVVPGATVVLVEGAGDVMGWARTPAPETAVATLGTSLTEERAALLAAAQPGLVVPAPDADAPVDLVAKLGEDLAAWGLPVGLGRWAGAKDAGAGAALRVSSGSQAARLATRLRGRLSQF